jgi:hypothetical protein
MECESRETRRVKCTLTFNDIGVRSEVTVAEISLLPTFEMRLMLTLYSVLDPYQKSISNSKDFLLDAGVDERWVWSEG